MQRYCLKCAYYLLVKHYKEKPWQVTVSLLFHKSTAACTNIKTETVHKA